MAKKTVNTAELETQIITLTNQWKRALADYQNLEKRIETQQANIIRLASVNIIQKLLPVIDDLERAVYHLHDSGIDMILKHLKSLLDSEGVTQIDVQGKVFDPVHMECVEMVGGKKDQVIRVIQHGYMLNQTVLRPAKVEVGNGNHTQNS